MTKTESSRYKEAGVDIDKGKIHKIQNGIIPFKEKGLEDLFIEVRTNFADNYKVSSKLSPADAYIISVPTPHKKDKSDMSYVYKAIKTISTVLRDGDLVVLESTSPPCSTNKLKKELNKTKKNYLLSYCPERAFPGNTIHELINNDRIVGGINADSTDQAYNLYKSISLGVIHKNNAINAEVCKLVENAFRDVNIAFANQLAILSEEIGFNTNEVISLANKHPRVNILSPGAGVGGHCIPVDPWFLIENAKNDKLIEIARKVNNSMPKFTVNQVYKYFGINLGKIGLLGIAYKEGVDDYRESPALEILKILKRDNKPVRATDPYITEIKNEQFEIESLTDTLEWANTIIITTGHPKYKNIDWEKYSNIRNIFDTRGIVIPNKLSRINLKTL